MADNKVIKLQKEILKLTKVIKDNGTATKEQSKQLDKLEKQYQRLSGKVMPLYRKRHDEVNDALKASKKITSELDKANKGFFGRLKTAVGTLLRYSLAYRAINAVQQFLNELLFNPQRGR